MLFSKEKFISSITKCSNSSTLEPNKLSWKYLKIIVNNTLYLKNFINIANVCIDLGHWLLHFKMLSFIIIPKSNKVSYNSLKTFRPIILLNMLDKLIKKVIGKRLQFQSISKNFIHLCQLGRLKQYSTVDAGMVLTHFIHMEWVKNFSTSTLAFDIAQFFPSLDHQLLPLILDKAGFDSKISLFFQDYPIGKKMKYLWNSFSSFFLNIDIGVGQSSALSPILSALYLSFTFHIFEKRWKNLKIPIYIITFVNNGLFILQNKSLVVSNSYLFYSYHIMSFLFKQFGFVIKYGKMKVFHFSRSHKVFNPPLLDLTILGGFIFHLKKTWHYLGFIFDRKLTFQQHVNFYTNKAISTVKCMKILRNLLRGLIPTQKHFLYRTCVLPIALYSF